MKFTKKFPIVVLSVFLLTSCGGGDSGGSDAPQQEEAPPTTTGGTAGGTSTGGTSGGTTGGTSGGGTANFDVTLDSSLTSAERTSVRNSIDTLEKLQIDGAKVNGFSEVFGGNSTSSVVRYLERRVNYIVSQGTDHSTRLIYPSTSPALKNLEAFASNQSVVFWYFDKFYESEGGVKYSISNRPREISSSNVGIVELGGAFNPADAITQAITLVHEARHSDCPDGALASDIINVVQSGGNLGVITNPDCGQLHFGPGGSDYSAWGPYAIDYIYSIAIFDACTNCTESQKQQALINANQVQGAAFDINGTLNGVYGRPDMSNSTTVRDDL